MIKNDLKFALRLVSRNKLSSAIIALGLSVAIAATIIIVDYVMFEYAYEKSFSNHKRIYRVHHSRYLGNELVSKRALSIPEVGIAMKNYLPGIKANTRLFPVSINIEPVFTATSRSGERKSFSEGSAYAADSNFCKVFDLHFVYGDPATALSGPDQVIISRSSALRYYRTTNVVGEILKAKDGDLTITGVFDDLPANTHFKFDMLLSWFEMYDPASRSVFTHDGFYNYVLLEEGVSIETISQRMAEFTNYYTGDFYKDREGARSEFTLMPLPDIHLDSRLEGEMKIGGNRSVINSLLLVALFMVLIAVINHVNLNASRSLARLKEVVVRKTIGSTRIQLAMQFFVEALMMCLASALAGIMIAVLCYPEFNLLFNSQISLNVLNRPAFWMVAIGSVMATSVVTGFYPAFMLSGVKVREALKGSSISGKKLYFQKVLVTSQFTISLILIVITFALYEQVRYMQTRDLGFDIEKKIVVKLLPSYGEESDTTFILKMDALKNELVARSLSGSSTITSSIPGRTNEWRGSVGLHGAGDRVIRTTLTRVDENFLETLDLKLVAGRQFTGSPDETGLIINLETVKQLGLIGADDAVGRDLDMMGVRKVIGVVESFHEAGLQQPLSPSIFITHAGFTKFLIVSMKPGNIHKQLSEIEELWKSYFSEKPFEYFFLDEYFDRQYKSDVITGKGMGLFSSIAIIISCLGLFSLSVYTVHRKTKEIGIKKVLGAGVSLITRELCGTFIAPLIVSAFIGLPASYLAVKWWLEQYSYRIDVTLSLFILPFIALFIIGVFTVLFQSAKAARKDPVESLKYE